MKTPKTTPWTDEQDRELRAIEQATKAQYPKMACTEMCGVIAVKMGNISGPGRHGRLSPHQVYNRLRLLNNPNRRAQLSESNGKMSRLDQENRIPLLWERGAISMGNAAVSLASVSRDTYQSLSLLESSARSLFSISETLKAVSETLKGLKQQPTDEVPGQ